MNLHDICAVFAFDVQEGCGMQPHAHKSQVYSLDPSRFSDLNLAGTGEVGVAGDESMNFYDMMINLMIYSEQ